jgi:hypothetical protein
MLQFIPQQSQRGCQECGNTKKDRRCKKQIGQRNPQRRQKRDGGDNEPEERERKSETKRSDSVSSLPTQLNIHECVVPLLHHLVLKPDNPTVGLRS